MTTGSDPRADRSRENLHLALVRLTLERKWDGFNVKELCSHAGVSRSTFYSHFADKEDVLLHGLDLVRNRIIAAIASKNGEPTHGYVRLLTEHVRDARHLLRAILNKKVAVAALEKFRAVVSELVLRDLSQGDTVVNDDVAQFLAGGLVELLLQWSESEAPVQDVHDSYMRFYRLIVQG